MSLLAGTNPNQAVDHPGADTIAGDATPTPTPSPAEVIATFFPSDAGGTEYLFGGGMLDSVPTPLSDIPVNEPDAGAVAMAAVNEGYNAHVTPMPDIPTPVVGGATDVPLSESTMDTPPIPVSVQSTLKTTLVQEGNRLKQLFVKLGGPISNG
jgi:hypothetical protein